MQSKKALANVDLFDIMEIFIVCMMLKNSFLNLCGSFVSLKTLKMN